MAFKRNRDSSFETEINEGWVMTWRNQEDGWPGTRDSQSTINTIEVPEESYQ